MKETIKYIILSVVALLLFFLLSQVRFDIPVEQLKPLYANENSKFMELGGMNVHYRDEGAGIPLVLIHGTGSSLQTWDGWTEELSKEFRIVRLDLPGFGLTGPNPQRDYSMKYYTDFLDSFLIRRDIRQCYIAGNSLGGEIGWEYALAHPEKVKKLILLDAAGYPFGKNRHAPLVFSLARMPVLNHILRYVTPRYFHKKSLKEVYVNDAKVTDELVERYYKLSLREGNRQAFIDRAQQANFDDAEKIKQIKTPTLIQWGAGDIWIPVQHAYKFKSDLVNSRLLLYDGAGHVPMEEMPVKTAKDAGDFLRD